MDMADHVQGLCLFLDPLTGEEYRPVSTHLLATTHERYNGDGRCQVSGRKLCRVLSVEVGQLCCGSLGFVPGISFEGTVNTQTLIDDQFGQLASWQYLTQDDYTGVKVECPFKPTRTMYTSCRKSSMRKWCVLSCTEKVEVPKHVVGWKRTWDQTLSSGLLLTFMTTHLFHFRSADTEQYWLITLIDVLQDLGSEVVFWFVEGPLKHTRTMSTSSRNSSLSKWRQCTFLSLKTRRESGEVAPSYQG